jgi:uncharacterized membrane protein YbhN (UPF0104 family)
MAWAPEAATAINRLPPAANRALGLATLATIVGYVAWVAARPRIIGRGDWRVTLPGARLTMVQIGIGILDLGSSACAMYVLLPSHPDVEFVSAVVTFVMATLLGFLSHAPGSLGVFEAAMLVALPQYETEQLLASLLLFRLLYFIIPFGLALLALGLREAAMALRARAGRNGD